MLELKDLRPFELLKLIRDGIVTHVSDLPSMSESSRLYVEVDRLLEALQELGWITVTEDRHIYPTERIFEAQSALGLSLTTLAPYGNGSIVATPLFGSPKEPTNPSDVFVMMPFASELRPVYDDHIRAVTARLSITTTRADDFFSANFFSPSRTRLIRQNITFDPREPFPPPVGSVSPFRLAGRAGNP